MKKITIFIVAILFTGTTCLSQNINPSDSTKKSIEIEAQFPGGDAAWRSYLDKKLDFDVPVRYGAPIGTYEVVVRFMVTANGSLSDIKAVTNFGYGMEAEVISIIKKGPKWKPAFQNGKNVNAYRRQSITFTVSQQ